MKFWQGFFAGVVLTMVIMVSLPPAMISAVQAWQESFYQGKTVFVKAAEENLRTTPSPTGEKIGVLSKGAGMVVLQDVDKWLFVNMRGFIWKESVTGERGVFRGQPYRAAMILLKTEAEALEVIKELQAGGDFAKLAAQKSLAPTRARGGDLGDAYPGDFSKEIEAAILALKVGQISGAIKSDNGYQIFKRVK
jgi:hypothetical protein